MWSRRPSVRPQFLWLVVATKCRNCYCMIFSHSMAFNFHRMYRLFVVICVQIVRTHLELPTFTRTNSTFTPSPRSSTIDVLRIWRSWRCLADAAVRQACEVFLVSTVSSSEILIARIFDELLSNVCTTQRNPTPQSAECCSPHRRTTVRRGRFTPAPNHTAAELTLFE